MHSETENLTTSFIRDKLLFIELLENCTFYIPAVKICIVFQVILSS